LKITPNNFDLIRLFAAFQVVLIHSATHLHIPMGLINYLSYFPGVPIFFFTSGFLISLSWEKNPSIKFYASNRALRIFPALWVCLIFSLFVLFIGAKEPISLDIGNFIAWLTGQLSFVQFYNPDYFRAFGVGVLNGSLWTITVELQFYFIIPMIYLFSCIDRFIILISLVSMAIFIASNVYADVYENYTLYKLLQVSFLPWLWMFLAGTLVQRHFKTITPYIQGKFFVILILFIMVLLASNEFGLKVNANELNPIYFFALIALILAVSFNKRELADKLLKRNDYSYGIYIYHMPIINLMVEYSLTGKYSYFAMAILLTITMGILSWHFVERGSLKMKKYINKSIYDHQVKS